MYSTDATIDEVLQEAVGRNSISDIPTLDSELVFGDASTMLATVRQGQYSSNIASLTDMMMASITYPGDNERPPLDLLTAMAEKDPVVSQCVSFKALRASQNFGDYKHSKREIELFVQTNIKTLRKSFKQALFKLFYSTILYGLGIAEFTLKTVKGKTLLFNFNVLNPAQIRSFRRNSRNTKGDIEFIEYDNGGGRLVFIPYKKCVHIINNAGAAFDKREVWGVGNGLAALPYHNLKKIVLTNLGLAVKNNSSGLIHVTTPPNSTTILLDSKGNVMKKDGVDMKVSKQVAMSYQMQDIYKKDFIVTDEDVTLQRIQIQNTNEIHFQSLTYIDRAIQQAFGIPSGIFDASGNGSTNLNQGIGGNFKTVFDATITSLTTVLKNELIHKLFRRILYMNFPSTWVDEDYGEFVFDVEDDQTVINGRLSTIASLIASGIIPANDVNVLGLIYKNLGLPALDDDQKRENEQAELTKKAQEELQSQANLMQLQSQLQQMANPMQPQGGGVDEEGYPTGEGAAPAQAPPQ